MRKYTNDEQKLFAIINEYGIESQYKENTSEYIKEQRCKGYRKIKNFLNSLEEEEIKRSIYLNKAKQILNYSFIGCATIIKELMTILNENQSRYEINLGLPEEVKELIIDNETLNIIRGIYFLQLNMMIDLSPIDFNCDFLDLEEDCFKLLLVDNKAKQTGLLSDEITKRFVSSTLENLNLLLNNGLIDDKKVESYGLKLIKNTD